APGAGGVELAGLTSLVAGRPAGQAQHWSSNRCSTNILNGPLSGGRSLRRNLLIYGLGGIVVPFVGIKAVDLVVSALGLV
ncbi:MAG: hypothetical protein NTY59_17115, partial [Alphaproteobacteria bacterium]|nr:hypothetical protein [Alphaproteobacteria bacterium]